MKYLLSQTLKLLSVGFFIVALAGCDKGTGIEKISLSEAKQKMDDTKNVNISFLSPDSSDYELEKDLLKKASKGKKSYYVNLSERDRTSHDYQNNFSSKYTNEKEGIIKTNKGEPLKANDIVTFNQDIMLDDVKTAQKETKEFIEEER